MEEVAADLLPTFLAGRDVNCPGCGYNLRDLQGARCPECGDALVLRVGLADPRQAAPICGLVGLAAGAGLNGLLLLYAFIRIALLGGHPGSVGLFLGLNFGGLVVVGTAMWFWLRRWQSLRRLPPRRQVLLVAACWLLTLIDLVVFTVNIR